MKQLAALAGLGPSVAVVELTCLPGLAFSGLSSGFSSSDSRIQMFKKDPASKSEESSTEEWDLSGAVGIFF